MSWPWTALRTRPIHPTAGKTWRLAPHAIQISLRYAAGLQMGAQHLQGTQRRYGTPPGMAPDHY